jgi:hypothetical protein
MATVKLEIETTPEGAARLAQAFAAGQLTELAGFQVVYAGPAEPVWTCGRPPHDGWWLIRGEGRRWCVVSSSRRDMVHVGNGAGEGAWVDQTGLYWAQVTP